MRLLIAGLVPFLCAWLPAFPAWAETLTGRVVAVADGDTLTIVDGEKKQHRIRLAEIDAPKRGQPFGTQSRRSLSELCLSKAAEVDILGRDGKRYLGRVKCAGVDASAEQVRRGMAWFSAQNTGPASSLYELEAHARLRQAGLWADDNPIAPWEWREKARRPTTGAPK